ncbi:Hypothetical protein HVR_LOCUS54 [uncultured virus]|nr:Hypothetical protein HVR_LOCUS54 [uncultured virus]
MTNKKVLSNSGDFQSKKSSDFSREKPVEPFTERSELIDQRSSMVWTLDRAQKAAERGYYIMVPVLGYRTLKSAEKVWSKSESKDDIYHPTFRITGAPEDVIKALQTAQISKSTIEEVLATSISNNNYQSNFKALYEQTLNSDLLLFAIYKKAKDQIYTDTKRIIDLPAPKRYNPTTRSSSATNSVRFKADSPNPAPSTFEIKPSSIHRGIFDTTADPSDLTTTSGLFIDENKQSSDPPSRSSSATNSVRFKANSPNPAPSVGISLIPQRIFGPTKPNFNRNLSEHRSYGPTSIDSNRNFKTSQESVKQNDLSFLQKSEQLSVSESSEARPNYELDSIRSRFFKSSSIHSKDSAPKNNKITSEQRSGNSDEFQELQNEIKIYDQIIKELTVTIRGINNKPHKSVNKIDDQILSRKAYKTARKNISMLKKKTKEQVQSLQDVIVNVELEHK